MRLLPPVPRGLRARILITVGVTTLMLMMVLSWGILYSWRRSLVRQERADALAVTRAFSVGAVSAKIFADQGLDQSEGFLDNYVEMFMSGYDRLRAITILGPEGEVVARSWDRVDPPWVSVELPAALMIEEPASSIVQTREGPWILETVLPMRTGERRWGTLVLAVEADSIRGRVKRNIELLALFSMSVASVMLILLWLLLGRMLGSLQTLVTAMDSLDLNAGTVPELPDREDEIGIMYKHFRRMQERLEQSGRELVSAESQIWHAERLAAIGRLASGLAHEINNPINGVRNCIYAIRRDPENREQTAEYLDMMDEGLAQATAVIGKLLGYARRQTDEHRPVNLNEAVDTVQQLVAFQIERKHVRLESDLAPDLPEIVGDRQLVQEVVMNLLLNAADAVETGGAIRISTARGNGVIELSVADTGHGIPAAHLSRIFEPFFTTKKVGEGTGLGLSICHRIVEAQGGRIEVRSEPGEGTVFRVVLPIEEGMEH